MLVFKFEKRFGLLLFSAAAPRVVKSTQTGILQHDGFSWAVARNRFAEASLSSVSQLIEKSLDGWLDQMDGQARRSLTQIVFSLFESTGAQSFDEISRQKWKSLEAILSAIRKMPREKQQEALASLQQLGISGGQTVSEYLASRLRKEL